MRAIERLSATWSPRIRRALPWFPWLSLATGVGGALLMNRAPTQAWLVVAAALVGWAALFAVNLFERWLEKRLARSGGDGLDARTQGTRFALLFGSQAATQTALFFPLPFYVKAASLTVGHGAFFVVYAVVVVVSLWDPLYAKAMARPWAAFCVQAFSVFTGLNMVLPVLGLSNRWSLYAAGAMTAVGVPILVLATLPPDRRRLRWLVAPAALFVVAAARLAAPLVPPAPLELTSVAIGSRVDHKELVDAAPTHARDADLVCHTAVKAPLGLKDALVHAWRKDGERLDEIALVLTGGREAGFRTWSKKKPPPAGWSPGRYTCRVQTATGQVLGATAVRVE